MIVTMKCRYLLSLVFLLHIWVCKSNVIDNSVYDYGLTFLAHSTNQDQRTNLDLTPAASLSFPEDGFSVGFDIKLRQMDTRRSAICQRPDSYCCRRYPGGNQSFPEQL